MSDTVSVDNVYFIVTCCWFYELVSSLVIRLSGRTITEKGCFSNVWKNHLAMFLVLMALIFHEVVTPSCASGKNCDLRMQYCNDHD